MIARLALTVARASGGRGDLSASKTVPTSLPCPPLVSETIFSDGFESGDTSAWSRTVQ